jgi:uncharacterized peroxidase-related enzyme
MAKVERRISRLPVPERDAVPEDVAALFDKAEEKLGFIPNVMRVMAFRPTHLMKWFAHYDDLMRGESPLTKAQREMIAVVVSATNRCNYCVVSHSAAVRLETGDATLADFLAANYRHAPIDARDRAMLDFAHKLTVASHELEEEDLEELRRHGFSDEQIFEIGEVAAMFNFTNRLASAFGWVPNELYHDLGRHPEPSG